ncbi:InlB B-repeat-containing protein [Fibrobacter sp. UWEL]|uniref:InlB B-repeat-containing protein n=1 Tax=Fibrobacter sp. UWEL TaxID=1896209 RepID=UPI0009170680|nr:InlB B-repeat-containing protein [Fibrobacter sp. UWEL]SHL38650.1 Listeria/Bacterioides repeat-containing protein [Fibrobacter sp. UWEL]
MKTTKMNIVMLVTTLMVLLGATSGFALTQNSSGYYEIGSCKDLIDFKDVVSSNKSANAILTASINMNDEYESGVTCNDKNLQGLGESYAGTFDGDSYSISNWIFDDGGTRIQNMGLFNTFESGAVVQNLVLENITIIANGSQTTSGEPVSVGSIVGWMPKGTIANCFVSGSITIKGESNGVGGIVGYMDGGTVRNCLSTIHISASNNENRVGGIAGYSVSYKETALIERCVYDGTSLVNDGDGPTGAIVGSLTGATKTGYTQNDGSLNTCYFVTSSNVSSAAGYYTNSDSIKNVSAVENLNTPEIACALNGGDWEAENAVCSVTDGAWGNGLRLSNTGISSNEDGEAVYTITYDANGGSFPADAMTQKYLTLGTAITGSEITVPVRSDYTFKGWSKDPVALAADADLGTVSKAETVYAVWEAQITVSFNAHTISHDNATFADGSTVKSKKMDDGAAVTLDGIASPEDFFDGEGEAKVYYTFMGWSRNSESTVPDENLGVVDENNLTFYAVWNEKQSVFHTVTFDANNHGVAPLAQRVEDGYKASAPTAPSADGFNFVGWYSNAYGTGAAFDFANNAVTSDVTLFAKWNAVPYGVVYNNVDAEQPEYSRIVNNDVDNSQNPLQYTALDDAIALANPVYEGWTFGGWFYDENLTNPATEIASGSIGEKTFYAKWTPTTYTVTFVAGSNGSGTVIGNAGADKSIKSYNVALSLPSGSNVFTSKKANTRQVGWSFTDGSSTCDIPFVDDVASYSRNADAALYPCWEGLRSYNVTYTLNFVDANGVKVAESVQAVVSHFETLNHMLQSPETLDGFDVPGFTFKGWTSVKKSNGSNVTVSNGKFTMPSSNVNVVGSSVLDTYTITYNNLGDMTQSNAVQYTVLTNNINLTNPTDSAKYAFVGWYDNANFSGEPVTTIAAGSTGDKTLYAKWRRVDYGSVKISADGLTVTVESDSKEPVELSEEGIEVENIVFERSGLETGVFATAVLPFDLPEGSSVNAKFYTFYTIKPGVDNWTAYFKPLAEGVLPNADVPYLFKLNAGNTLVFTVNGKAVVHAGSIHDVTSPSGDWTFKGTYKYHKWGADDPELGLAYGFAATDNDGVKKGKFGKGAVNNFIYPTRAYLKKKDESVVLAKAKPSLDGTNLPSKSALPAEIDLEILDDDGAVMAIGKMNSISGQVKIDRWIDLNGRQSNKYPSAKGVYFNKKF